MNRKSITISFLSFVLALFFIPVFVSYAATSSIATLLQELKALQEELIQLQSKSAPTSSSSCVKITHTLMRSSRDLRTYGDVSKLQKFLISEGYFTTAVTGYYGPITLRAVEKFQIDNHIVKSARSGGYGMTGKLTEAKIKAISCGKNKSIQSEQPTVSSVSNTTNNTIIPQTSVPLPYINTPQSTVIQTSGSPSIYTIVATTGNGGNMSPSGTSSVVAGNSLTYTITPNSGYQISTLTIDGTEITPTTTYTFLNVNGNHVVNVLFNQIQSVIPPVPKVQPTISLVTPLGPTLLDGALTTISWNYTGSNPAAENFTISAFVNNVWKQIDQQNNTYNPIADFNNDGKIDSIDYQIFLANFGRTSILGDLNGDGKVDFADFIILSKAFGSHTGDPKFNAAADFNHDGVIDNTDFEIFNASFGKTSIVGDFDRNGRVNSLDYRVFKNAYGTIKGGAITCSASGYCSFPWIPNLPAGSSSIQITNTADNVTSSSTTFNVDTKLLAANTQPSSSNPSSFTLPVFPVFDSLYYNNKPSTDSLHMIKIYVTGDNLDTEANVRSLADRTVALGYPVLVLDIEWLPMVYGSNPQADVDKSIAQFEQIISWIRSEKPQLKVGIYAEMPWASYWIPVPYFAALDAIKNNTSEAPYYKTQIDSLTQSYHAWQTANAYLKGLASQVDYIFPSLYSFYNNPGAEQQWEVYAKANIDEARQYGKPVFPFIWPRFHPGGGIPNTPNIPGDYWTGELNFLKKNADGIVLWNWTGNDVWDSTAPWWVATQNFIAGLNQ